jgi:hypothetical protein
VLKGRKKLRRGTIDQPLPVSVSPEDPAFGGRLLAEINSAYGPAKISKILQVGPPARPPAWTARLPPSGRRAAVAAAAAGVARRLPPPSPAKRPAKRLGPPRPRAQDHGRHLGSDHLSMAISVLAGTAHNKQLTPQQRAQVDSTARRCGELLGPLLGPGCSHLAYARAAYGLARLGCHDAALFGLLAQQSREQLMLFTPESLSGLLSGLAQAGHRPDQRWLERFCLESYARLSKFGPQELAAMVGRPRLLLSRHTIAPSISLRLLHQLAGQAVASSGAGIPAAAAAAVGRPGPLASCTGPPTLGALELAVR